MILEGLEVDTTEWIGFEAVAVSVLEAVGRAPRICRSR